MFHNIDFIENLQQSLWVKEFRNFCSAFGSYGQEYRASYFDLHCVCMQAFPVMMGEVEPSGNLNANIIHQFTKHLRCKFISQV